MIVTRGFGDNSLIITRGYGDSIVQVIGQAIKIITRVVARTFEHVNPARIFYRARPVKNG